MRAGILTVAAAMLAATVLTQDATQAEVDLQAAIRTETVLGDLKAAIAQYEAIAARYKTGDRALTADALVRMAGCYQKLGDAQARQIYERVLREYADQPAAAEARERLGTTGPKARTGMQYRRLWVGDGVAGATSISADGRFLGVTDWSTGDLALHDLQSGSERRLTSTGGWDVSDFWAEGSAISPDGSRVAYAWYDGKGGAELRVIGTAASPAGTPRTLLARGGRAWLTPHAWSPDGRMVAVSILVGPSRHSPGEIALVSVADRAVRTLREVDARGVGGVAFSPDGAFVAFDAGVGPANGDDTDVFVRPLAGGPERVAARHPGRDRVMGWSADGRTLLFASDRGGTTALWGQPMAAGQPDGVPRLIKADIGDESLGTSGSGDLYVSVGVSERNVYVGELDLAAGRLVGQRQPAADRHVGANTLPDWSPDGRELAYLSRTTPGGRRILAIRSMETGETRELQPALGMFFRHRWAPDGRSLGVQGSDLRGEAGLFRVDAASGEVTPLVRATPECNPTWLEWSRDGSKLYYHCSGRGSAGFGEAVVERDLASGAERELLRGPDVGVPALSPDGTQIAVQQERPGSRDSVLVVLPVSGGEPREVLRVALPAVLRGGPSWTPDGRLIVGKFLRQDGEERELLLVSTTGGEPRPLDLPGYQFGGIRFHPDGRRVAYTAGSSSAELWVLEGLDGVPAVRP